MKNINSHLLQVLLLTELLLHTRSFQSATLRKAKLSDIKSFLKSTTSTSVENEETGFALMYNQGRELGSQELLMLPRQYDPNRDKDELIPTQTVFPPMSHVCAVKLSKTPKSQTLKKALKKLKQSHPLLQCVVKGDGEPNKRIDLFQMVREGNPNPCTFILKEDESRNDDNVPLREIKNEDLEKSWKSAFAILLDNGISVFLEEEEKLLWNVQLHTSPKTTECVLLFQFNHAISDQSSVHVMIDHFLRLLDAIDSNKLSLPVIPKEYRTIPTSLEDAMLKDDTFAKRGFSALLNKDTLAYIAKKGFEGIYDPVLLPDNLTEGEISKQRSSVLQFKSIPSNVTELLLQQCRSRGLSLTHALTAAMIITASKYVANSYESDKSRNYKLLQSLDMRRFEQDKDPCMTPSCHAGSMDIIYTNIKDYTHIKTPEDINYFWSIAQEGSKQTKEFLKNNKGPYEAIKVFDFATTVADMNNLVYMTSQSDDTLGRAYSCGVVNVGRYESLKSIPILKNKEKNIDNEDEYLENCREPLQTKHGRFALEDIYFATSHKNTGCLYQTSICSVNNEMKLTFHPADPLVTFQQNENFANDYVDLLKFIATDGKEDEQKQDEASLKPRPFSLPAVATTAGIAINLPFLSAWFEFIENLIVMKEKVPDSADFWAAFKFWIFFAVGHAILQPILLLSDALHASPGFLVGDLVPVGYLAANAVFIAIFTASKQFRNAINISLLATFFAYIGAGLDGKLNMGDYNLAIQDPYKYQMVKGCPAYEDVRLPSMDNFDINKYQGKWYEQKFHDWTQFKEVYDTTLDIKLTPDGKGWIDDFAVKGPSPNSAKLSWDKSPVANGAHYFLFGRIDEKDPPGVLRESGFGVEFPNYIVDVQQDPKTGEYTEAIQFQCLERGGVRVFEGINFMSRKPQMSKEEMKEMHARAKQAGMYPYGASEDQMHLVERRDPDAPPIDNAWQAMWRGIGFDKLLEMLTESIEDGGR